jgi:hypothetical protein
MGNHDAGALVVHDSCGSRVVLVSLIDFPALPDRLAVKRTARLQRDHNLRRQTRHDDDLLCQANR